MEKAKQSDETSFTEIINGLLGQSVSQYKALKEKQAEILNFIFHLLSNNTILSFFFNDSLYFLNGIESAK